MAEVPNGGNEHKIHSTVSHLEVTTGARCPTNADAGLATVDAPETLSVMIGSKIMKDNEDRSVSGNKNNCSEDNEENQFDAQSGVEMEKSKTNNNPKEYQSEDSMSLSSQNIELSNPITPSTDESLLEGIPDRPLPSEPAKKIKVHFVAVGSAPILKKSKFIMSSNDQFARAIEFVRKLLKRGASAGNNVSSSSLFLYINSAFVPSPDERIGDLFDCFGVRGELVIHYSLQEAWG
ncbi:hypothetical protein ACHAXS_009910 [Conticribra weissflogii]